MDGVTQEKSVYINTNRIISMSSHHSENKFTDIIMENDGVIVVIGSAQETANKIQNLLNNNKKVNKKLILG